METRMNEWAQIFDAFERGKISHHEAHRALDLFRSEERLRIEAKIAGKRGMTWR